MTQESRSHIMNQFVAGALACLIGWFGTSTETSAQSMSNYTNFPITLNKTVSPNVLFLVDMGNATLEASYAGVAASHYYPLSFKSAVNTLVGSTPYYAANVTLTSVNFVGGSAPDETGLRAISLSNTILASTLTTTGSTAIITGGSTAYPEVAITDVRDAFDPNIEYYGIFDPLRCYTYGANQFQIGTDATAIKAGGAWSAVCPNTKWDGNFLNWLSMRKQEIINKVLVGGQPIPAQANADGTANTLHGETLTGENGVATTCTTTGGGRACWRYVKYVPLATRSGRVPDAVIMAVTAINNGATQVLTGTFFGVGEGKIYVNDNAGINPFDAAAGNQFDIEVALNTEPNVPAGNGLFTGNCDPADTTNYAGRRVCYMRDHSMGLFQKMQTGNMHVGVMMVNASTGKGGSLFFGFDEAFNASVVATMRNQKVLANSPLAESLYEALCLFKKSQGPCYSNSGSAASWGTNYTTATSTTGDPFYFLQYARLVQCCKNYVVMISPGLGIADGNNPDASTPFPTASTINPTYANNIGIKGATSADDATSAAAGDRLDDVAFYGRTTDLRADLSGSQYVTFYGVNALGRKAGANLIASAAKYGGFIDKNNDGTSSFNPTSGQTCTYPAGSNIDPGTGGPYYSDPEWDNDRDCVPDTFYDATDGKKLVAQIQNAINDILKQASAGTSISVMASSSTGEGSIYQAYFYPETTEDERKVSWTGYLQSVFIDSYGNLREDSGAGGVPNGRLIYSEDAIIRTVTDPFTNDIVVQRFADANGDGKADSTTPINTVPLRQTQGVWEAGRKLALRDITTSPRNLFTWVDMDNDGVVDTAEQMAFTTANAATLAPYLRAVSSGTYTAANIINFLHGNQITGMRDRQLTVDSTLRVWRLGDIVNSSPIVVGAPRERYDLLYGDRGYRNFLQRWADRRQTTYVGANDGMLHAFNGGYYHRGDDPNTSEVEHGWHTTAPTDNSSGPQLGEEIWGFIPHYVLPQLLWYTQPDYTHVSYVDLKPKVTDARIFTAESACGTVSAPTPTATGCIHPDGWGTILILGLRYGGSCGACSAVSGTSNGAPPLSVTADFQGTGVTTTRFFYSGYIVLDITDPSATPRVLSAYSSSSLGLTTAYPTIVRMSPSGDGKTDHANARWMMVVGSGMHGYDGRAAATPSLFAVDLVEQGTAPSVTQLPADPRWGYMADALTYDRNLDFRSDAVYLGVTLSGKCSLGPGCTNNGTDLNNGSLNASYGASEYWSGKLLRLTMGTCTASCGPSTWGVASGLNRVPTEVVSQVTIAGVALPVGPISAGVTTASDNAGNTWVFFGTGRYLSNEDKVDKHPQYLIGVKDSVMKGCVQATTTDCMDQDLMDVTNAAICVSCVSGAEVQGVGSTTTFSGLVTDISAKDGWVIQLPKNLSSTTQGAERSVVSQTLIGGAVLAPTFIPDSDVCIALGSSKIYGLYYLTGTGHPTPIFGVDADGKAIREVSLGQGLAASVAVHIGAEGTSGLVNKTDANIMSVKAKPVYAVGSQQMSWFNDRS